MRFFICFLVLCLTLSACSKSLAPSQQMQVAAIGLNAAALTDNGQYALIGSVHHGVSLWRTTDRERLYDWSHKENTDTTLIAADFSPDSLWALSADANTLALWDVSDGTGLRFWQAPGTIESVQLGPQGKRALLGLSDHTAVLFDVRKGGIIQTLHHNNRVRSVAMSADGTIAVTGSEDYSAIAWDLSNGQAISRMRHNDDVQLVSISDDGRLAMSASKYDRALIWRTEDGSLIGEIPLAAEKLKRGLRFTAARFSPENQWLLTGRPDQRVTLWQLPGKSEQVIHAVAQWEIPKKSRWKPSGTAILDVAFAPEKNQYLAVASNGFVYWLERQ